MIEALLFAAIGGIVYIAWQLEKIRWDIGVIKGELHHPE